MQCKTYIFYADVQRYIAATTIGPSALRNQGGPGVIERAQLFLSALDIRTLAVKDEESFLDVLDTATAELQQRLPVHCNHWGAARKAINLFLRDICYNRFLSHKYSLAVLEPWIEIPLDSLVAFALKRHVGRGGLPSWPGLKGLTPPVSLRFQRVAKDWADTEGISRAHLDMRIWIQERTKLAKKARYAMFDHRCD
jgi:hypothetical protein